MQTNVWFNKYKRLRDEHNHTGSDRTLVIKKLDRGLALAVYSPIINETGQNGTTERRERAYLGFFAGYNKYVQAMLQRIQDDGCRLEDMTAQIITLSRPLNYEAKPDTFLMDYVQRELSVHGLTRIVRHGLSHPHSVMIPPSGKVSVLNGELNNSSPKFLEVRV